MKKCLQIVSLVTLLLVLCTSMTFAAARSKKIAVLPLQAVNCRYGTMTDEIMADLNEMLSTRVDNSLNDIMTRVDTVDPEEALSTFQRIYKEKKAVNKKATYRDAVALTARELKADLIIVPVAENCVWDLTGDSFGHRSLNYMCLIKLYVYDKMTGTTNTFQAKDHYNGYDMEARDKITCMRTVLSTVLKRADLSQTIDMSLSAW